MDIDNIKRVVTQTFENKFDRDQYLVFLKDLLKDEKIGLDSKICKDDEILHNYEKYITSCEHLYDYKDIKGKKISLLIVWLKSEHSILARVAQRNFISKFLEENNSNAALVAFVTPNNEDWRFSFVEISYEFTKDENGKRRIISKASPAKRWSFLLGKNEKSHTAQTQIAYLLQDETSSLTLEKIKKAFNIEVVTDEFFREYRNLFIKTKENIDKVVQNNEVVKAEFNKKNISSVDFAKTLLGQIVFLYFLQKKGWFGVEPEKEWGTGPKDFLRRLFDKKYTNYNNFFNDILEPLFYEALRTNRNGNNDYYDKLKCKIPFLNGGLFDPINDYDWVNVKIPLPNDLFSNNEGNGILDVLDKYNFTVNEEEPLDKEVALDPELLGKIYEKLNAITQDNFEEYIEAIKAGKGKEMDFNKKNGVYYTPREIVGFMSEEVLIAYLEQKTGLNREHIQKFLDASETLKTEDIPEEIKRNIDKIESLLENIKICDPAVGSGSFPIEIMHKIVKSRALISLFLRKELNMYELKRSCIEKSLYGVDIDPGATEICKLRYWLSLIVDENDIKKIRPLPNLDFKIIHIDSLNVNVARDMAMIISGTNLFDEIAAKKDEYFNETDPVKKKILREEINKLLSKFENAGLTLYFFEVFKDKGGFDIVITNPPYVKSGKIRTPKSILKQNYKEVFYKRADYYVYFYERAYDIVKENGIVCFISSNKWLRVEYGFNLRRFLRQSSKILLIVDFDGYKVFEQNVDTSIIIFQKTYETKGHEITFVNVEPQKINDKEDVIKFIKNRENRKYIPQNVLSDDGWILEETRILNIKEKIEKVGRPLKDWDIKIHYGIKTGFDEAFIIDSESRDEILRNCKTEEERKRTEEIIKPVLKGRDIKKYRYKWAGLWIILAKFGFYKMAHLYPAVVEHLSKYEDQLKNRGQCRYTRAGKNKINKEYPGQHHWLELDNNPSDWYLKEFGKEKIVWKEIVSGPNFAYDTSRIFVDATANIMTGKNLKYLIGLLNSKPVAFFFKRFYAGSSLGKKGYRYKKTFLERLVLPPITLENVPIVNQIVSLVDQILEAKKQNPDADTKDVEAKIDELIYKLYSLTEEEIRIIEK